MRKIQLEEMVAITVKDTKGNTKKTFERVGKIYNTGYVQVTSREVEGKEYDKKKYGFKSPEISHSTYTREEIKENIYVLHNNKVFQITGVIDLNYIKKVFLNYVQDFQ